MHGTLGNPDQGASSVAGQTTVPKAVRQVLDVKAGDEITFRVEGQRVTILPMRTAHEDPLVAKFLSFLARDMGKRPEALKPMSKEFAARLESLTKETKVDLDASIDGDVDL